MDKEIEDLLHSLDIDVARISEIPDEPKESGIKLLRSPCRLFSFTGYLSIGLISGILSLHTYHSLHKPKPVAPVRLVAQPSCAEGSFYATRSIEPTRCTLLGSFAHQKSKEDPLLERAPLAFFEVPSVGEEVFVRHIRASSSALGAERKSLATLLLHLRPLEEREKLRALSRSFDMYLRSHLLASHELEARLEEQMATTSSSGKSPLLYMNLFGGTPQEGCTDVVRSAQKIEREIDQLFIAFNESQPIEDKALISTKLMKLFEKVQGDKLLSILINVREGRKKLDRLVQSTLDRCHVSGGAARTIKEVRSLSLLESCLLKGEMMSWNSFEKELHPETKRLPVSAWNQLSIPTTAPASERIDWTYRIEYTPVPSE